MMRMVYEMSAVHLAVKLVKPWIHGGAQLGRRGMEGVRNRIRQMLR
jgi:hypothetical protein